MVSATNPTPALSRHCCAAVGTVRGVDQVPQYFSQSLAAGSAGMERHGAVEAPDGAENGERMPAMDVAGRASTFLGRVIDVDPWRLWRCRQWSATRLPKWCPQTPSATGGDAPAAGSTELAHRCPFPTERTLAPAAGRGNRSAPLPCRGQRRGHARAGNLQCPRVCLLPVTRAGAVSERPECRSPGIGGVPTCIMLKVVVFFS